MWSILQSLLGLNAKKFASRNLVRVLFAMGIAGLAASPCWGQSTAPSLQIGRVSGPPALGEFLDLEAASRREGPWTRVEGFVQRHPHDGERASQRTVVLLGYDSDMLHVVFLAFDEHPERIRARMAPREGAVGDDFVLVMLDTFHDRRRAYTFESNPVGVQWDALWTEGQGYDSSFDAVWHSRGALTDRGYVVLISIPFKSLRFPKEGDQEWGLILRRDVARGEHEKTFWPRVSSRIEGRLNQAALLRGLRDLSQGRNFQVIPFGSFRSFEVLDGDPEPRVVRGSFDGDAGLDVKAVIHDSLVADVTVNPDFSQIESDQPQVTVNQRFEVFFPEKRPFFLENADLFQTPLNLVFTRRIADPRVGGRLTGKVGPWALGVMRIDDEAPGRQLSESDRLAGERADFTILRAHRDLGRQSRLGTVFTERRFGPEWNRVGGIDGRFKLDDRWVTTWQAVASSAETRDGQRRDGEAYSLSLERSGRHYYYYGRYLDVSPEFRTDVGFIPRTDIRDLSHFASFTGYPERRKLVSWGAEFEVQRIWDHRGLRLDDHVEGSLEWLWPGDTHFEINYRTGRERLRRGDLSGVTRTLDFDIERWVIEVGTSLLDSVSFASDLGWGNRVNFAPPRGREPFLVDWFAADLQLVLRPLSRLRIDNDLLLTRLAEIGSGARVLDDWILRSRWNWQFTSELSLRLIVELDRTDTNPELTAEKARRALNTDLLVTYRLNPWTAFFVGYNTNARNRDLIAGPDGDRLEATGSRLHTDARQLFAKVSYLVRF